SWGTYRPSWVEITITAGTFAGMCMLYMLFSKAVPVISVWELKGGDALEHQPSEALMAASEAGD
ncbi:MAG: hypothetical protein WBL99_10315, partial [Candidatus Acidiferrales bacterium]